MHKFFPYLVVGGLLFQTPAVYAQMSSANEPVRPSTESWTQIQYGEVSPSLYTGTLHLTIPFFTYKDPDFEIPVSFSYTSNGCLPNDPPGILGPGWTLDAGGLITREIHGIPDDESIFITENSLSNRSVPGYYAFHIANRDASSSDIYCADAFYGNRKAYYFFSPDAFYDAEPDVFHFNFMGHTGTFHLGPRGKVFVYGTSDNPAGYRIEFDFMNNPNWSSITITTSDGFKYIFKGNKAGEMNTEKIYSSLTILAWHLCKIVAPNGREAEFLYDYPGTPYFKSTRPNGIYISAAQSGGTPYGNSMITGVAKELKTSDVTLSLLSAIKVDGSDVFTFSYAEGNAIRSYRFLSEEDDLYNAYSYQRLLTSVSAKFQGTTVKSCSMVFDDATKSKAAYLDSLIIDGTGSFVMSYHNKQNCPLAGTFKIDHWGYFNGKSNTADTFLNVSTLDSNLNESYTSNNPREPDPAYSKLGILTRITYPTGGYSEFDYEAHDYAYYVQRLSSDNFSHSLTAGSGIAGGVRIKSISHRAANGALLAQKQYAYRTGIPSNSPSSGVLTYLPRYKLTYSVSFVGYTFSETGTIWSNNISRHGGSHIEYSDVFETNLDGSRVHYQYTTSKTASYLDFATSQGGMIPDRIRLHGYWDLANASVVGNLFLCTSLHRLRGRLYQKELITTNGAVVATEQLSFVATTTADADTTSFPRYLFYCVGSEPVYIGREDIGTHTQSRVYGSQPVSTTTAYSYNGLSQRLSQTVTGSRGEQQITRWAYTSFYSTAPITNMYRKMYDAGQIDRPVCESIYTKAPGATTETLLLSRTWTYSQPDAVGHPDLFCATTLTEHDAISNTDHVTSYIYDKTGRIVQKTDPSGVCTAYVWGYDGLYPVAEIVGAGINSIQNAHSSLSNILNAPISGPLSAAAVSAIQGLGDATVWEYSPLVGLTKETTPDGRSTTYTYNATGKLHQVLNDLSHLTDTYLYSTDNRQQ